MKRSNSRTYGEIEYLAKKDQWCIPHCEPHIAIRLKKIFPKVGMTRTAPFYFNSTPDTCTDLDWFLQRYPLAISKKDRRKLTKSVNLFWDDINEREAIFLPDWKPIDVQGLREGERLKEFQKQAVALLQKVKRLLLVDDIGLGKTYEGLGSCLIPGALPAAVVVESHLPKQWMKKAKEFTHLRVHFVKTTKPYDLPEADLYVFRYSVLSGWVDLFTQGFFKLAIFDEIQQLRRGEASEKGKGAKVLLEYVEYAIGLTATPIYGYGIEIFEIMNLLNPGFLGTREEFIREWCTGHEKKVVADPDALGAYLQENHAMLRRTRADVGEEMDPVNPIVIPIDYDQKVVDEIEDLAKQLAMTALTGSFNESGVAARQLDLRVRHATGVSKAKHVAQYVRMVVEAGEPVLLGGWHREVYDIWLEELKDLNPMMYTGSETGSQKEKIKQAFINGESDILIMSNRSGAGADGIQERCSVAIIGELDWSGEILKQLVGRLDRDGQTKPVLAIYLLSTYGSDPVMKSILGLKSSQARGITDPGAAPEKVFRDPGQLKKLAESFLSKKELQQIEEQKSKQSELDIEKPIAVEA